MKRSVMFGLAALGVLCLYLGQQTGRAILITLGVIAFALILVIYGIDLFIHKRLAFRARMWKEGQYEAYTGLSAQLWGVFFVLIGILLGVFSLVLSFYPGGMEKFWADILGTTQGVGITLTIIGFFFALDGVIRILAGTAGHNVGLPVNVGNCLERIGGGIVFLFGLALLGVGLLLIVDPVMANQFLQDIISYITAAMYRQGRLTG